jgi:hypothetical protein
MSSTTSRWPRPASAFTTSSSPPGAPFRLVPSHHYLADTPLLSNAPPSLPRAHPLSYRAFAKLWRTLRLRGLTAALRPDHRARARARHSSVENDTPLGINFARYEYARERTVLEAPVLALAYYVDVVGPVPDGGDGQGEWEAPEWGVELVVQGGVVRYGPWADRQRAELQRVFFPPTYVDAEARASPRPGEDRAWTALRVFVELRDGTTLHIPFREPSKNWQWDGQYRGPRPRRREGASLSIKAGDDSTISYLMPMLAGDDGYRPLLEVHLDSVTVSSSLNDIRLLTAESCRVRLPPSLLSVFWTFLTRGVRYRSKATCTHHSSGTCTGCGSSTYRFASQCCTSCVTTSTC